MELKLNIYDDTMDNIIKTYTTETFKLKLGVVEDLLQLFDLDGLENMSDKAVTEGLLKRLPKCYSSLKELLKIVFKGLTDSDLRNVALNDLVPLLLNIVKYSFSEISLLKTEKK